MNKYNGHKVHIQLISENLPKQEHFIKSASDVYDLLKDDIKTFDREVLLVITLNTANKVLGVNETAVGTLNHCTMHPREIFKPAILQNAASIILAHNHPSGKTEPSFEDKKVTEQIYQASKILSITLLDHVIIGDGYYSFSDNNQIN